MTFYPKAALIFVAVAAIVILAANARAGDVAPSFAVVGVLVILAVEAALFYWLFFHRKRTR